MRALILAAGRGNRMNDLTRCVPKALLEINGISLLSLQLRAFRNAGIENIALVRGYLAEKFDDSGLQLFENKRWHETNMVRSVLCAKEWLEDEDCIISYADIFYTPDTIVALKTETEPFAISYDKNWYELWNKRFANPLDDAETFKIDKKGFLLEIGKKTKNTNEIQGQYMGLIKLSPKIWWKIKQFLASFPEDIIDKYDMTSLLQKLIENNFAIKAVPCIGAWGEVDQPSDLKLYEEK